LEHKIVRLALRPLFLVLGITRDGSSLSSVSSARAILGGIVLGPPAAAVEDAAGAADAGDAARLGRFLTGSKHTRVPETGPAAGPAEAAAGGMQREGDPYCRRLCCLRRPHRRAHESRRRALRRWRRRVRLRGAWVEGEGRGLPHLLPHT
jgi:hypothetical protein